MADESLQCQLIIVFISVGMPSNSQSKVWTESSCNTETTHVALNHYVTSLLMKIKLYFFFFFWLHFSSFLSTQFSRWKKLILASHAGVLTSRSFASPLSFFLSQMAGSTISLSHWTARNPCQFWLLEQNHMEVYAYTVQEYSQEEYQQTGDRNVNME